MKKIFFCTLVAMLLLNCDVSVKKTKAQSEVPFGSNVFKIGYPEVCVQYHTIEIDGMRLCVFASVGKGDGDLSAGGVHVVNLTKEKLEIELLKKQLQNEKR